MKRREFIKNLSLLGASSPLLNINALGMTQNNSVQLLRHATLIMNLNGKKILVDPMLSAKDEMDPIANCGNEIRIPMVDLPIDKDRLKSLLNQMDAIIVTHLHRDHWDAVAHKLIDKNKLIICQPVDEGKIKELGFMNTKPITEEINWGGIKVSRTGGQHGTGEIGQKMGTVSGFVLKTNDQSVYVAGDTIWCDEVKVALDQHKPDVTILNGGGAKFLTGDPITMTADDIMKVHQYLPETKIIAVHMDTVNHCFVKRADLRKIVAENGATSSVLIPLDNEVIDIT